MSISNRADPQLTKLYRWEVVNGWDDNTIAFDKASSIIISACKLYNVEPPTVLLHTTRALPWSCPTWNIISLQRDRYLNVPISLHEAAHHIVYKLHGAKPQDHGPTFLGIYLDLLNRNEFPMFNSAKAYGLRWKIEESSNR